MNNKIKTFVKYYKPHKKLFFIDLICAFFVAALDLVYPMITRDLMNDALPNKNMRLILVFSVTLLILYLLKYICSYIMEYWGHVVGARIQYDMRKDIFAHLQRLPFKYFDDNKTGQIMSRIVNDLVEVSELAHHGPEDLFISAVMLVGSFIALCTIDVKLTLIIFAFIPFMVLFVVLKKKKMDKAFRQTRKKVAELNSRIESSISGIRVSKSFTNEDVERERFDLGNTEFKKARVTAYKSMAEFFSGMKLMMDLLQVVVILAGGYFAYKGHINTGDLVAYLLYINFFMNPIRRLTVFVEQFEDGMAGFERFVEIMNLDPEVDEDEGDNCVKLEELKGDIELKDVSFNYNENKEILNNVSLDIKEGTTVALVGPSGAGKTTLCHLIPRFYDVTSGEILIDGININNLNLKSLRDNIGIVQQDVFLFAGTIRDNIIYGRVSATEEEVIEAAKSANIHDFIISLPEQYDTYVGERGVKLSGGQKQRISIARVFLKNPPILILDEATSALDNESEMVIQKSIEMLCVNRTVLVVAHRLSTIKNADTIVVLTKEGIKEEGSHEKLMKVNGIYAKLYNAQFRENR